MTLLFVFLAIAFVVAALLKQGGQAGRQNRSEHQYLYKPLLTENEKEFFVRLQEAVPDYTVLAQVAMGALMTGRHASGEHLRTRGKFAQKMVDYVVLDDNLNVVLLIELDDRTHSAAKDASRDAMTSQAGYRTLRIESRAKPSVRALRNLILDRIASVPARPKH